ncbi:ThiF family adenylyltransferase [Actinospica sp. MGRD01-02]|uniref:ThiF family adenylyltransferase n=1 Tax=Actinospica acidithermotolerans TaxID=2828514 RepID=A0A941IIQ4_9ACTN|nr:ThiF family adenylyltransferase [Actinospica acidithermotolerans]MBR7829905.1 ThiF family adenylyltransferase [Actinospica acidithermotolerans]
MSGGAVVNPPAAGMSLTIPAPLWEKVHAHLFPGDRDEHGAIILAGLADGPRGPRLLAREAMLAVDGVDYVPGQTGYRALTDDFVNRAIDRAEAADLAYIAVHCHRGTTSVAFSSPDIASHERCYPAIVQMTGQPVGGLVLAVHAADAEVFMPDGSRTTLAEVVVPGANLLRLRSEPAAPPVGADPSFDRQSRLFGQAGQGVLGQMRVAVVGLGGIGSILVELLGRLGVGHLVVIDPDKVAPSNLHRLPAARRIDAMTWLRREGAPALLQRLGLALSAPKTRLAARNIRRANRGVKVTKLRCDVSDATALDALKQADWIFLAADTNTARHAVNAVVHQYLVPGVQVGVSIPVADDGQVGQLHVAIRPLVPGEACQWCQELIDPAELAMEALPEHERTRARYVRDEPAPSVMTLNTIAAGEAATYFMLAAVGLHLEDVDRDARAHFPRSRERDRQRAHGRANCRWCSTDPASVLGLGDARALPGQ